MVKIGSSLLPPVKGQEWDNRFSYTVRRSIYECSPVQSSGLETASHLTVANSLVQPSAPSYCCDIEHGQERDAVLSLAGMASNEIPESQEDPVESS